jgi:hypothetical protein
MSDIFSKQRKLNTGKASHGFEATATNVATGVRKCQDNFIAYHHDMFAFSWYLAVI